MLETVQWLQENHTIYIKYNGILTLDSFREGSRHIVDLMQATSSEPIHLIMDMSEKAGVGEGMTNVAKLAEATRIYRRQQENGLTIFVDPLPDIALRFTCRVVFLATRLPIHHVASLADATTYLSDMAPIKKERPEKTPSHSRKAQRKRPL